MPQFTFIARTKDGKRKEGSIEASNINRASEKLKNRNLTVIKLTERDTSFDFMGPFLDRLALKLEKYKTFFLFNFYCLFFYWHITAIF